MKREAKERGERLRGDAFQLLVFTPHNYEILDSLLHTVHTTQYTQFISFSYMTVGPPPALHHRHWSLITDASVEASICLTSGSGGGRRPSSSVASARVKSSAKHSLDSERLNDESILTTELPRWMLSDSIQRSISHYTSLIRIFYFILLISSSSTSANCQLHGTYYACKCVKALEDVYNIK